MEEMPHDSPLSESGSSDHSWWPSDFIENPNSVLLVSREENSSLQNSSFSEKHIEISPHAASQVLWETGCFSAQIPNGFYTAIPVSIYFWWRMTINSDTYYTSLLFYCTFTDLLNIDCFPQWLLVTELKPYLRSKDAVSMIVSMMNIQIQAKDLYTTK